MELGARIHPGSRVGEDHSLQANGAQRRSRGPTWAQQGATMSILSLIPGVSYQQQQGSLSPHTASPNENHAGLNAQTRFGPIHRPGSQGFEEEELPTGRYMG